MCCGPHGKREGRRHHKRIGSLLEYTDGMFASREPSRELSDVNAERPEVARPGQRDGTERCL